MESFDPSTLSPDFTLSDADDSAVTTIQTENDASGHSTEMIVLDVLNGVAVAFNLVVLLTVLTSRKLRHGAAAALVVSLVTADMLNVVSMHVCLEVMWSHDMDWIGEVACKTGVFLSTMFSDMAIFMLIAIARERYLAVVKPLSLHSRKGSPLRWGLTRAATCWLLATILAAPDIIMHEMVDDIYTPTDDNSVESNTETDSDLIFETSTSIPPPFSFFDDSNNSTNPTPFDHSAGNNTVIIDGRYCGVVGPEWMQWFIPYRPAYGFVVLYVVPMTLIGFLYGRTAYTLATSVQQRRGSDQGEQRKKRFQAARSVIALVVIVVVCLLPLHIVVLLHDYKLVPDEQLHAFAFVGLYLFAINVTMNAVMVCVLGQAYRQQLLKLFCIRRCMRRSPRAGRKPPANGGGVGGSDEHGNDSGSHSVSSTKMMSVSL